MPTIYSRGYIEPPPKPREPDLRDYWVYVLECEGGFWYVGISRDVAKRYRQHLDGKGCKFTREHPPLRLFAQFSTCTSYGSEAEALEREMALNLGKKWGVTRVFAAGYLWACIKGEIIERDVW